jgi:hypothetical protein
MADISDSVAHNRSNYMYTYNSDMNSLYKKRRWPRGTIYPKKLALTSPTNGGRSVGIVRSRTQAKEFTFFSTQL